jgi:hypothetical protein
VEDRVRQIAERLRARSTIKQAFSAELASVADNATIAELKKRSKEFLLEHARLDNEPSGMPEYTRNISEALRHEQREIASRLGLNVEQASSIRREFAERMSREISSDRAVPVGDFLHTEDLRPFLPLLKKPQSPNSNPDVSVYEAPFDGCRFSWWYHINGVNPHVSNMDRWCDQATGLTGSQISFYMGTDGDENHFDGGNSCQVAIIHQMNRTGRIRVIALLQCVHDTQSSRIIDESGFFGVPGISFNSSTHVFNMQLALGLGDLTVGQGIIRDSSGDDPVPLQAQTFGFDVPITFNGGQDVVLWMGTAIEAHVWGDDVQIFYNTLQQWQLRGVIVLTV